MERDFAYILLMALVMMGVQVDLILEINASCSCSNHSGTASLYSLSLIEPFSHEREFQSGSEQTYRCVCLRAEWNCPRELPLFTAARGNGRAAVDAGTLSVFVLLLCVGFLLLNSL
jgi:hypothetical protein